MRNAILSKEKLEKKRALRWTSSIFTCVLVLPILKTIRHKIEIIGLS